MAMTVPVDLVKIDGIEFQMKLHLVRVEMPDIKGRERGEVARYTFEDCRSPTCERCASSYNTLCTVTLPDLAENIKRAVTDPDPETGGTASLIL
jgi:hypothetical protein